jgi:hypothetical protein
MLVLLPAFLPFLQLLAKHDASQLCQLGMRAIRAVTGVHGQDVQGVLALFLAEQQFPVPFGMASFAAWSDVADGHVAADVSGLSDVAHR